MDVVSSGSHSATEEDEEEEQLLQPAMKVYLSQEHNSSGSSFPIRALPSTDSDVETSDYVDFDHQVGGFSGSDGGGGGSSSGRYSGSSSNCSVSSYESDGFVSGEEDFVSERTFVADPNDGTLNGLDDICSLFVKPTLGSSDSAPLKVLMAPKAQVSCEYDEDDDGFCSEAEEDGFSGVVRVFPVGGFQESGDIVGNHEVVRVVNNEEDERGDTEEEEEETSLVSDSSVAQALGSGVSVLEPAESVSSVTDILGSCKTIEAASISESLVADTNKEVLGSGSEELLLEDIADSDLMVVDVNPVVKEISVDGMKEEEVFDMKLQVEEKKNNEGLGGDYYDNSNHSTGRDSVVDTEQLEELGETKESDVQQVELPVTNRTSLDNQANDVNPVSEEQFDSKIFDEGTYVNPLTEKVPSVDFKHLENDACLTTLMDELKEEVSCNTEKPESLVLSSVLEAEATHEDADDEYKIDCDTSISSEDAESMLCNGPETNKQIIRELEQGAGADTDEEDGEKELFNPAALAALLKAASRVGSEGNKPEGSSLSSGSDGCVRSFVPSPDRVSSPNRSNLSESSEYKDEKESEDELSEEANKTLEKIQLMRVKFLRLLQRLGLSHEDYRAAQVLHRLFLAGGRHTSQAFGLETAKKTALQLDAEGKGDLDFSLNILVLGKTGAGKSATINSIFDEEKSPVDAFRPATTVVKEILGTVDGVKIRAFDTPGLRSSAMEQSFNRKILCSVKKLTKKFPPDIVLYVDRLDTPTRDLNDLPLLRSITDTLGSSIWRSAIIALTHAVSAFHDESLCSPFSYEAFVAQQSCDVRHSVSQAVGGLPIMNPSLAVALVENHPSYRRDTEGQKLLPNDQSWRTQLLLLCYSMKILAEVNSMSKHQDPFDARRLYNLYVRSPSLPQLFSSLLQSRAHLKLPGNQGGEIANADIDLEDLSDYDKEEENDKYDQLPPFKPLRKSQIARLSKEHKKAYLDEYDDRVKLLQKKQLKIELKRLKEMKKGKGGRNHYVELDEDVDQNVKDLPALPAMVLPHSFDGDDHSYRYRDLAPFSQLPAKPTMDTDWDHNFGYDGIILEKNLAIARRFPAEVSARIKKDKEDFDIYLDSSVAAKHGENGSSLACFNIQSLGEQVAYIVTGETAFKNLKRNKTTAGVSVTILGENVTPGVKLEDQLSLGKRLVMMGKTAVVQYQGGVAFGANFEARLKDKEYPIGQDESSLGLTLMNCRNYLILGAYLQSQVSVGRSSKISFHVGWNNKHKTQLTVRTSSSEQLQIALLAVLPIASTIFKCIWPSNS